jgi:hypothetical protein
MIASHSLNSRCRGMGSRGSGAFSEDLIQQTKYFLLPHKDVPVSECFSRKSGGRVGLENVQGLFTPFARET